MGPGPVAYSGDGLSTNLSLLPSLLPVPASLFLSSKPGMESGLQEAQQSHPQGPINIVTWLGALNLESSSTTQKLGDLGQVT